MKAINSMPISSMKTAFGKLENAVKLEGTKVPYMISNWGFEDKKG